MPRKRYIDGDILERIRTLAEARGWTPSQIYTDLAQDKKFKNRLPSRRTVQRIVSDLQLGDVSEEWTLIDAEPSEVREILDALYGSAMATNGQKERFTKEEARWALRVRRAAPNLSIFSVHVVVREYLRRLEHNEDKRDIDLMLAAHERFRIDVWRAIPRLGFQPATRELRMRIAEAQKAGEQVDLEAEERERQRERNDVKS